jgi:hypothetical protein
MLRNGTIREVPPRHKADEYIIKIMEKFDGSIVLISNDQMREYREMGLLEHQIQYGFAFGQGHFVIYKLRIYQSLNLPL